MGGLNVLDVRRERIPLLWSTVRERCDVSHLPSPVLTLRAVIWFPFPFSCLVLLPTSLVLSGCLVSTYFCCCFYLVLLPASIALSDCLVLLPTSVAFSGCLVSTCFCCSFSCLVLLPTSVAFSVLLFYLVLSVLFCYLLLLLFLSCYST